MNERDTQSENEGEERSLPSSDETERLLVSARQGDASSLWRLTQSYRPYLKAVVRKTLGSSQGAFDDSDVLQRSMAKAVEKFGQFYGRTLAEWQSWLVTIAKHEAQNVARFEKQARRDLSRRVELDPGAPGTSSNPELNVVEQMIRRERASAMLAAIERLSLLDQEIIRLRNFEALSHREIADRLGITMETARRRWCDALKRLKQQLGMDHEP